VFAGTRTLVRIAYRDPEHISERITLYASSSLAEPSRAWAKRVREASPGATRAAISEELRMHSARLARVDGAVAGTPFLIALVPGYAGFLWQEARMALRIAALYGRDPSDLRTAAETLVLRGVHPDVETAEAELARVRDRPLPERPSRRRPLRTWVRSAYLVLVFGGFLSRSDDKPAGGVRERLRTAAGLMIAGVVWAITWIAPLTFMIAMSWGCESHTRELGRRVLVFYDGEAASARAAIELADRRHDRGRDRRTLVRSVLLLLSVAIPFGFIAYANTVRQSTGVSWVGALGALVALSVVIAAAVLGSRR
jgi:hypothetical protein